MHAATEIAFLVAMATIVTVLGLWTYWAWSDRRNND